MTSREEILQLSKAFYDEKEPKPFVPGESPVPVSGKVIDGDDIATLVDSCLDAWFTTGRFAKDFERDFAALMGVSHCLLVNSGSSANLLAISALTSKTLRQRALLPGDEVITVACGFPTTVNPILQNQLIPVFIDASLPSYNADLSQLEAALSKKTKAVIFAHTLGNPFDIEALQSFCKEHQLWLIEDCCDAVGSTYKGKPCGSFGDLATVSFYPAHHITMGEGGAVLCKPGYLKKLVESFRDWGRDCWCAPGEDDSCCKRFAWKLGELPFGYDHKYTYSHIGYNLKLSDMQAALGCSQLKKLAGFTAKRKANFARLYQALKAYEEFLILPESLPDADPSWFGFPLSLREEVPMTRAEVLRGLESRKIATRLIFGGNLLRQPAYKEQPKRVLASMECSDFIMNRSFWIGIYPGIGEVELDFVAASFGEIFSRLRVCS